MTGSTAMSPVEVLVTLAAGALGGLMFAALNFAGPVAIPLVVVALTPTFMVGLGMGSLTVLLAMAAATVTTAAVGDLALALKYAVFFAAPQAWLIRLALTKRGTAAGVQWYPPGLLLVWLTAIAAFFVIAAAVAFTGADGGLVGTIKRELVVALRALAGATGMQISEADVDVLAPMVPGIMAITWMLMMVANGALAQTALVRAGRNLRPPVAFADLEAPAVLMYALGVALLLSLFPGDLGFIGKTLITVVTAAYLVVGLAVIHAAARRMTARRAVLMATYFLIILLQWLALAVVVLGLAEHVFGLRKRYLGANKGEENE